MKKFIIIYIITQLIVTLACDVNKTEDQKNESDDWYDDLYIESLDLIENDTYEYDINGNMTKDSNYDSSGVLQSYTTNE